MGAAFDRQRRPLTARTAAAAAGHQGPGAAGRLIARGLNPPVALYDLRTDDKAGRDSRFASGLADKDRRMRGGRGHGYRVVRAGREGPRQVTVRIVESLGTRKT